MKKIAITLIMSLGIGLGSANAEGMASLALMDEMASDKLAARDWSAAEAELVSTDFAPEDQIFAKVNLAFLYGVTGRKDQAVALYQEIIDGRDNSFAMTLSGMPRKVKYIAKDGLKMFGSL
ncbi:hypothetical protein [Pseudemcibacter aquimaris]|uniref:hypothetical protein n=1 Tax=Pseudemcibacter aquimaris TaxID=2857064 RepID=UPI0020110DE4|nr:hypothetical protein [Pseudemcibacter aquimaris]MCC3861767.1 hypothetical protein [Pseudemcibacter aquimaris]WDU58533.1 hypothetical protein KW060_15195 [Pseudemcibacter aquimaris]